MNGRELGAALRSGQCVYGTMITSPSPRWPDFVCALGIDFVFIDTEHVAIDRQTLSWMCQTYRALNLAPVVRIPTTDPTQACMVLDGGACGVIAPYMETAEEVRALRGAVKLRPLKGKRLADVLAGRASLETQLQEYLADWNADNVLIVNIESREAVESLEDILSVPQVDAILIGPHDLSCSLGIPEQYTHPLFDATVRKAIAKAREMNVGAGIHFASGLQQEIDWAHAGANLIVHSSDLSAFRELLAGDFKILRESTSYASVSAHCSEETSLQTPSE